MKDTADDESALSRREWSTWFAAYVRVVSDNGQQLQYRTLAGSHAPLQSRLLSGWRTTSPCANPSLRHTLDFGDVRLVVLRKGSAREK